MAGENACALKSREKDYFSKQYITSNVLQTKTFWYQFCNFKHFLKAENSEDSLATSCAEKPISFHVTQYDGDSLGYYWN